MFKKNVTHLHSHFSRIDSFPQRGLVLDLIDDEQDGFIDSIDEVANASEFIASDFALSFVAADTLSVSEGTDCKFVLCEIWGKFSGLLPRFLTGPAERPRPAEQAALFPVELPAAVDVPL